MKKIIVCLILLSGLVLSACGKKSQPTPTSTPAPTPTPTVVTGVPILETDATIEIPEPGSVITSPVDIKGLAPGPWFFEGQIQGQIVSESGEVVSTFPLKATSDWMTTEFVHFEGHTEFSVPDTDRNIHIVIKSDNPSGSPENEHSQTFDYVLQP